MVTAAARPSLFSLVRMNIFGFWYVPRTCPNDHESFDKQ